MPTEPHGLRRVASPGTNGYTNGRTPHANGSSVGRPLRDADAGPPAPLPDRRDALPTGNGRPPAERPEQGVSATGQRRVADLLADAQRERAAQEAQREARERAAAREARERAAAEAQREARERAVREARERAAAEARERAAQEARERAAQERAAAGARERVAQERAAAEARERAAQERAAAEARERLAQERAAQERAAQERAAQERAAQERAALERAAQERAAAEARERAAREARERAAAQPPSSSYRPAWSPAEPRPGLLAAPPLGAADPFGGGRPDDRRRDHRDDVAPLRLGGAPPGRRRGGRGARPGVAVVRALTAHGSAPGARGATGGRRVGGLDPADTRRAARARALVGGPARPVRDRPLGGRPLGGGGPPRRARGPGGRGRLRAAPAARLARASGAERRAVRAPRPAHGRPGHHRAATSAAVTRGRWTCPQPACRRSGRTCVTSGPTRSTTTRSPGGTGGRTAEPGSPRPSGAARGDGARPPARVCGRILPPGARWVRASGTHGWRRACSSGANVVTTGSLSQVGRVTLEW